MVTLVCEFKKLIGRNDFQFRINHYSLQTYRIKLNVM